MKSLSDESLLELYNQAVYLGLDEQFIQIIGQEIDRRALQVAVFSEY